MSSTPISPFDGRSGHWLRCALHVHTTASDGWLNPHIQRQYHVWGGFDVLAITDHDMFTPEPDGEDDLVATFLYGETGLPLGESDACLTGEIAAEAFEACDTVVVHLPGCGLGVELALLLPPVMWLYRRRMRE